ncbi:hypothetical protein Ddye_009129 [Dipteronia dyeriana]|uniref:Uncharacterized protein n=1 Tax=Dipteronia dyeriana TaxID=168575 RepID=A0AAD9XB62_9ROSI|nr:hypothetical protein Ddye_009129 [Dipteronia dyeriana]
MRLDERDEREMVRFHRFNCNLIWDTNGIICLLFIPIRVQFAIQNFHFNCSFGFLEALPIETLMMVLLVKELPKSKSSSQISSKQLQKLLLGLKKASKPFKSYPKQAHFQFSLY